MTTINSSTVTATISRVGPDLALKVLQAQITLDEYQAPYIEAVLTVVLPATADLADVDPRNNLRVTVAYDDVHLFPTSPQNRTFDLILHKRTINAGTAEMTLTLVSDEAALIDDGHAAATLDASLIPVASSLRNMIDEILVARLGLAALAAGAVNADFTATYNAVNLIANPSVDTSASSWAVFSGPHAVGVRSNAAAHTGTSSFRVTNTSFADTSIRIGWLTGVGGIRLKAGSRYKFGVWVRTATNTSRVKLFVEQFNATHASSGVAVPTATITADTVWRELTVEFTVTQELLDAGIASFAISPTISFSFAPTPTVHYFDSAYIVELFKTTAGTHLIAPPFF